MRISLINIKMYDLNINGVVFKTMRQTGKLEGVIELTNGKTTVTLLRTFSNLSWAGFGDSVNEFLNNGKDENWLPIRGTPDVQEAMKIKAVDEPKYKKIEGVDHDPYYEPVELQPDPVLETVLRSDFDFLLHEKQRAVKLIEEAYEFLAQGKIFEAKELLEKRVNNRIVNIPVFIPPASTKGK